MQIIADRPEALSAIRCDLGAIFISLELSRSTWLITSLSPSGGEKMSKHSVPAGDICVLLARFSEIRQKAFARTGKSFPVIVIQEAGLDGFWIHRVLQNEGIESHVVDPASIATSRRRRRAKTDRIDGEALLRALLAHKRGEPQVCAMVKAPAPEEEDRRRLCRERKVLIAEAGQAHKSHQRIAAHPGRVRLRAAASRSPATARRAEDGRWPSLPSHLKTQISRELDRLELLLQQIKAVETERDALLAAQRVTARAHRRRCCSTSRASGPSSPPPSGRKGCSDTSTIDGRSLLTRGWRRRPGRADLSIANRACLKQATRDCDQRSSSSLGYGCAISRNRSWLCGLKNGSGATAAVLKRRPSWRWRESCWWRSGNM